MSEAKGTHKKPLSLSPLIFKNIYGIFIFEKKKLFKGKPVERQGRKARRD